MPGVLFALSVAVSPAPNALSATLPATQAVPISVSAHLTSWTPRPFSEIVLENPDLASCFLLQPRLWSEASAPSGRFAGSGLDAALVAQLRGLTDSAALPPLDVTIGGGESKEVEVAVHGAAALVLVPNSEESSPAEVARVLAPAILDARLAPAVPDPRCSEPLLALAEALVDAGSIALAGLPPTLRPVRDWLEVRDADAALSAFVADALDPVTHWQSRRASMAEIRRVGGATPQLGAATALLVEAFGDASVARTHPLDFLLAWQKGLGQGTPQIPRALRRALANPLAAGMPKEKGTAAREDGEELRRDVWERLIASGTATLTDVAPSAGLSVRLEVAAQLRARGEAGLCRWLTAGRLPGVRTGCRGEDEDGGFVFARPRRAGFEVVWKPPAGDEVPLLVWPRWILFPVVAPGSAELWFLDPLGVWRLPLDARTPPRLALPGSFRYLTVAPDGSVACARWPDGPVVVILSTGARELGVNGRAGVAWLGQGLLVASDGESLSLASLQGETRSGVFALPCGRALAMARGGIIASVGRPCGAGLVRVALPERTTTQLLKLPDAPLGVVALPGGALALGTADGLLSWHDDGSLARIGTGLTPGPG